MSNVSHPVSLYKFSSDISFVVPVAILAASVWIFSRSSFSYCVQLSQIRFALWTLMCHLTVMKHNTIHFYIFHDWHHKIHP